MKKEHTHILIERAKDGDEAAFSELISAHYDMIYRSAYKWCGNRADAQDVAQDVCIKAARAISGFRADSQFSSWLYRIVVNTAHDMRRGTKYHTELAQAETVEGSNASEVEAHVSAAQLWEAVRRLPPPQDDAVMLVYSEGLNHKEVAVILGCKEGTVSYYIHEAKKALALIMNVGEAS